MNIVEAYIKNKGQLVILISGLSGSGKTRLAKNISRDFKIKLINELDFYNKSYNKIVTLNEQTKILNWDDDDAILWNELNNEINTYKTSGVVVCGMAFPSDKITVPINYHIHLSIPKKMCIERRHEYLRQHKDKCKELYKLIDTPTESLIMNKLTYPYHLDLVKRSKINKFINVGTLTNDEIYDKVFDFLKDSIENFLYKI